MRLNAYTGAGLLQRCCEARAFQHNIVQKRFRSGYYPTLMTSSVEGIGNKGEIVLLKAGTARNFVRHNRLGLMIPTDKVCFFRNIKIYEALGLPIKTITKFYENKIQAVNAFKIEDAGSKHNAASANSNGEVGKAEKNVQVARKLPVRDKLKATTSAHKAFKERFAKISITRPVLFHGENAELAAPLEVADVHKHLGKMGIPGFQNAVPIAFQLQLFKKQVPGVSASSAPKVKSKWMQGLTALPAITKTGEYVVNVGMDMVPTTLVNLSIQPGQVVEPKTQNEEDGAMEEEEKKEMPYWDRVALHTRPDAPPPTFRRYELSVQHVLRKKNEWYGLEPTKATDYMSLALSVPHPKFKKRAEAPKQN